MQGLHWILWYKWERARFVLKLKLGIISLYRRTTNALSPTCTTIHRYPIFSMIYSVMCKVYTGYCGTSEIEHGLYACTVDNPLAKARGLSLRTGAQTMLYLSLVYPSDILIPKAAMKTLRTVITKISPVVVSLSLCTCCFSSTVLTSILPRTSRIIPTISCSAIDRITST